MALAMTAEQNRMPRAMQKYPEVISFKGNLTPPQVLHQGTGLC